MRNFLLKIILSITFTACFMSSEKFSQIAEVYTVEKCHIFKTFPRSDFPQVIRSESGLFNKCFSKLKSKNIRLVDRDNEGKVLNELMRQSTLPTNTVIPIGEIIVPGYLVTQKNLIGSYNKEVVVKLTSIASGEVIWKRSSSSNFLDENFLIIALIVILISTGLIIKIFFKPFEIAGKIKELKESHRDVYKEAIAISHAGNFKSGVDLLIKSAQLEDCLETKNKALKKLSEIKLNLGTE
ncbi:hypothetical protein A9Q84_14480 [Halobacteriovorax marinus]|uniref:Uncharacterized protein n=1 Tax=Halobacteriovorax marinus TaxID=97084 RepID=A0A1Y5FAP2_9BACT|nr:hypothetical protein A9Q84_14480 [Halobacteriovorax marinus]